VRQRRSARTVRLGFLGLGWIGRKRLDAIARTLEVDVAALLDCDERKLRDAALAYPDAQTARDIDELLACDLDGVVIATPNAAHADQAIACLSRGLPVFCQKPLGVSAREADAVITAAQRAGRLLSVDFCYRHVQGVHALRRRIGAGELGDILALELSFHNAYGPDKAWAYDRRLAGGGALLDLGIHLLDLALWLQPQASFEVVSSRLFADGGSRRIRENAVEHMALAELRQDNGAVVRIACSWHAHAGRDAVIGLELFGSRGGAAWRNVEGSFYDFTLDVFKGRCAERVASPPDDWGSRALERFVLRLRDDHSFDPEALLISRGAHLIEQIYQRSVAEFRASSIACSETQ
jgi:predicted dehydrogenase